ncbi:MAG: hypothetical protein WC379_12615 [Methanoregula sp.]
MKSKTPHQNNGNRQIIISTVLIRRGGAPSGAAEFYHFWGYGGLNPHQQFLKRPIYYENPHGNFHPVCLRPFGIMFIFMTNIHKFFRKNPEQPAVKISGSIFV